MAMKIDIAAGQITSPSRFQITVNTWILTKATAVDVFYVTSTKEETVYWACLECSSLVFNILVM